MAKATNSISKTFVWILLALLIVGLAGFGATSFSGTVRSVGSVGDSEISTTDYARTLQNEINALQAQTGQAISFPQAQAMGLPDRVLSQLVVTAALDHEAGALGISVGDETLANDLQNISAFRGSDGSFNREAYRFALQNAGLSEREFEEQLRAESAATLLQGAVLAGTRLPDTYVNTLIAYANERRAFTWAELAQPLVDTGLEEPTDETLTAWYEANLDRFMVPETKVLTYVSLTPDMIVDSVEVDEDALRAAYDEQAAEFNQPERRLVERLVYSDEASAAAARDAIVAGESSFEAEVESRGLALADTDMGDVAREDLGAAADAVFAAEVGDVVGPAPSDLGPALYRVNGILAASNVSFEEAQPMLRDTLALDRARRVIAAQAQGFDDEMAAGATLEDLARESDLRLGTIEWTRQSSDGIAGYDAFRAAAAQVTAEDFPQVAELGDGGVFALRLEEIREPAPLPFDEARADVRAGWELEQRVAALVADAEALAARLDAGEGFEETGLTPLTETGLTRTAFASDLPPGVLDAVFALSEGETTVLPGDGTALIVRLDAITPADLDGEEAEMLAQSLRDRASASVAQDLFRALATDIQTRAGVEIDQAAINAVHVNFQ
ncbi:peptidylprolyl isomerase [Cognatishimia sp. F0-27]|uniref:peptidylprolyl isomerase n=1 Tax=Cognatishimia sp. F0-27 TaxID=2816855 RepID=UPI001D0C4096|nr:peptidylprolyl isomerase [Cognatishimia sp. F0-27]MCC1492697.1 SurA N-terminal domain-containing protein [Cognatishimia sp. F0-27]